MTKIKIPPYPNYGITDEAFDRDIASTAVPATKQNNDQISNRLVIVAEFQTGERKVIKARPVKHKGITYVTAFPNPVHLFLSAAVEHFNQSEEIKDKSFPKCGKVSDSGISLLDIDANGTHECYNRYMQYRITSIVMLVSSIEAFLNYIIPSDFIYRTERKGRTEEFDKMAIESPKISFNEKLTKVIPQYLESENFWLTNGAEKEAIVELYENRKSVIHLKTDSDDDFERYFPVIDKMLDLDIQKSIQATVRFMNLVKADFVQLEDEHS